MIKVTKTANPTPKEIAVIFKVDQDQALDMLTDGNMHERKVLDPDEDNYYIAFLDRDFETGEATLQIDTYRR